MLNYRWSCFACGSVNASDSFACLNCGCPGAATLEQMQEHRGRYELQGGVVGVNTPALYAERPFQASRLVLAALCLVLFWYVPRHLR